MGLLGFVDKIIGTDLSGKKAAKYYEKGAAAQQAATQQALATMQQYGDKAVAAFKKYTQQGLDEYSAMQQAAMDAAKQGDQQAINAIQQNYNAGMQARQPYEQATNQMLGVVPYLQSAMGLPSTENYQVQASPLYQWQKDQADKDLTAQLNAMGISGDNTAAYIRSQNLAGLRANETNRQMNDLFRMAGMGANMGQSLGQPQFQLAGLLGGAYGNMGINQANLLNQYARDRSRVYNNMANTLGNYNLGMGANQANALLAGGQSAMNMGISRAQQPNGMNQLLNTAIGAWGMRL